MLQDTHRLLAETSTYDSILYFLFVGGTSLAFQVNHRVSKGLIFGFLGEKLPEPEIKDIVSKWSLSHSVKIQTEVTAFQQPPNVKNNSLDYHQDWLVDNVKVVFLCLGDNALQREAITKFSAERLRYLNILSLDGLFFTICLMLIKRIKSCDIFDIWWFTEHGKSIRDVFFTIQSIHPHITYESIRYRLLDWPLAITDKGIEPVGMQMCIVEVRNRLRKQVNAMEVEMALEYLNQTRQSFK